MLERLENLCAPYGVQVEKGTKKSVNGVEEEMYTFRREGDNVGPTMLASSLKEHLDNDEEAFVQQLIVCIEDAQKKADNAVERILELLKEGGAIMPCVINAAANEEFLNTVPHRKVLDLAIIYRLVLGEDSEGVTSTVVSAGLLKDAGLTEQQLFERAKMYAEEKACCISLYESLVCGIAKKPLREYQHGNDADKYGMADLIPVSYAGSNYGAAVVAMWADEDGGCAPEWMRGKKILPSSIHEIIVVMDNINADYLLDMVASVNHDQVEEKEVLSNSVYEITEAGKLALFIEGAPLVA